MSRPLLNKNLANPPFGSALPAIPSLDVVTDRELFYVRFHSRNALGWRLNKMATQFDYDYSDGSSSARRPTCCSSTTNVRGQEPWNEQRLLTRRLAERRKMNERESIHLNLADFVVAVERVLDRRLCMLPAAACFLRRRPASMGSANLVVHAANFVAPPSPNQLPSAAHSCSRGG